MPDDASAASGSRVIDAMIGHSLNSFRVTVRPLILIGARIFLGATLGWSSVIAGEPTISATQANEIIVELRAIRQLLEKNNPSSPAPSSIAERSVAMTMRESPILGRADAPITLVEFTDYQCPYCRRFHETAFQEIKRVFVEPGKVRYMSRDLPLPMHEHATQAASAARCADDQHKFWEMRHVLFVNSEKLARDDLVGYALDLNLDVAQFSLCLDQKKYDAAVQRDAANATQLGMTGTPSFLIGPTVKDDQFQGARIVGAQPFGVFEEKIRRMLDQHQEMAAKK